MKLDLSPRESLIVRIQAFTHENVIYGNYGKAQAVANDCLASFDSMVNDGGVDPDTYGYWASFYVRAYQHEVADLC